MIKIEKEKYIYNPNNLLGWSEKDFAEIIYDYVYTNKISYNPYPPNPVNEKIALWYAQDIQRERMGLTQEYFKNERKKELLQELSVLKESDETDEI